MAARLTGQDLTAARERLLAAGDISAGIVDAVIERSWRRCRDYELAPATRRHLGSQELLETRERHEWLLQHALPELDILQRQVHPSGGTVFLTDPDGVVLHRAGHADFAEKARRVELAPGACWHERDRGTNAIGTAIVEGHPVLVHGEEHFLRQNGFLTCCAAPIHDPNGALLGIVDVSAEARERPAHLPPLLHMTSALIENRLFRAGFSEALVIAFHTRREFLGTLSEGLLAVGGNGELLAANRSACMQLGLAPNAIGAPLETVLEHSLERLPAFRAGTSRRLRTQSGISLFAELRPPQPRRRVTQHRLTGLESSDPSVRDLQRRAERVLGRGIPILLEGETGTGKEVWAKRLHECGSRAQGPLVVINCAALPETLIEAELFGYAPGAFTGAKREGAVGKLAEADGGTLFLDEIGDMPAPLQTRLLRVLQEREVEPLGGGRRRKVDFDLICATNQDLKAAVAEGRFRADLYYRIVGLRLPLPPLRQRRDIAELAGRILDEEAPGTDLAPEVLALLERHPWPGNIRQLRSVLRVAALMCEPGEAVTVDDLPTEFLAEQATSPTEGLRTIEEQLMREAIADCGGNLSAAARRLGIDRSTLYRRLRRS